MWKSWKEVEKRGTKSWGHVGTTLTLGEDICILSHISEWPQVIPMMMSLTCDLKLLGCAAPVATFAEQTFLWIKFQKCTFLKSPDFEIQVSVCINVHMLSNFSNNDDNGKNNNLDFDFDNEMGGYFETWLSRAALACWWLRFTCWRCSLTFLPLLFVNFHRICSVLVTISLFTAVSVATTPAADSFSSPFSPSPWSMGSCWSEFDEDSSEPLFSHQGLQLAEALTPYQSWPFRNPANIFLVVKNYHRTGIIIIITILFPSQH